MGSRQPKVGLHAMRSMQAVFSVQKGMQKLMASRFNDAASNTRRLKQVPSKQRQHSKGWVTGCSTGKQLMYGVLGPFPVDVQTL